MSDSIIVDDDATPAQEQNGNTQVQQPAAQPAQEAAPSAEKEDKVAKGTQFVDFDQIPDKALASAIENRFKRVYWNVKNLETKFSAADEERRRMFEVNKQLAEELSAIKAAQTERSDVDQATALKQRIQQALTVADYQTATDLTEQLADLKAAQKARPQAKIDIPEPAAPQPQAMDLSQDEQRTVVAWQAATDENGQPLRPWANPAHPKFQAVQSMIAAVVRDPDFEHAPLQQILARVDQMMGTARQQTAQAQQAFPTADPNVQARAVRAAALSDQEKRVAVMMFHRPGIPGMAKTAEEAHNMYRRNKSAGGSRDSVVIED